MIREVGACAVCALIAACTAGPNYHVPDNAVILRPEARGALLGTAEPGVSQDDPPPQWWRLYDDPTLDGYIAEALRANADLRTADANLRRATAIVREAEASRTVETSSGAGLEAARLGGFTKSLPATTSYSLGMQISYALDLAGGVRRGIEAARASSEAVQAARDQVRVAVVAGVTRSYAKACSSNVSLAAAQHVLGVQQQTLLVTRRLFDAGRETSFDVTRAQAAVDENAATIPSILADRRAAVFELAALMGRVPADYPRDAEGCQMPPRLDAPLPVGDGTALLRRRPDIRAAERALAAVTANIGVEAAKLYPQVSLGGSLGFAGPLGMLTSAATFGAAGGPLVSWSWPNRLATRARIAEAGAAADASAAEFDATVTEALQGTESAISGYARQREQTEALERARNDNQRASDQAQRLFRFGRTSFLDLLTAQSNLATSEATLAQAKSATIDRQIDVFVALGGGWQS